MWGERVLHKVLCTFAGDVAEWGSGWPDKRSSCSPRPGVGSLWDRGRFRASAIKDAKLVGGSWTPRTWGAAALGSRKASVGLMAEPHLLDPLLCAGVWAVGACENRSPNGAFSPFVSSRVGASWTGPVGKRGDCPALGGGL